MFVGYLKGVKIITGETYLFRGKKVILKQVRKIENLYGFKIIEYWFQYYDSHIMFKVLEEELVKADFREWRDNNKNTAFTSNDMIDSFLYAMTQSQFEKYILGKRNEGKNLPRKVIFNKNKKATTLLYGDEATVVKACKGDKYDKEKGFLMAFFQKQTGLSKTQAKKYLKKIIEQE